MGIEEIKAAILKGQIVEERNFLHGRTGTGHAQIIGSKAEWARIREQTAQNRSLLEGIGIPVTEANKFRISDFETRTGTSFFRIRKEGHGEKGGGIEPSKAGWIL